MSQPLQSTTYIPFVEITHILQFIPHEDLGPDPVILPPGEDESDVVSDEFDGTFSNGLIRVFSTGDIIIVAGVSVGEVSMTVECYESEPDIDLDAWEDVVEIGLSTTAPEVGPGNLPLEPADDPEVNLAFRGPGTYQLRCAAKGRDTDPDGVAEEVFEYYLIQTWPTDNPREAVLKMDSEFGQGQIFATSPSTEVLPM